MPRTANRRPIYDVDARWNSMADMLQQFSELEAEYMEFIESQPQIKHLRPSNEDLVALQQLNCVLAPFKTLTLQASQSMPSIARTLELYWELDSLLTDVVDGVDRYSQLDQDPEKLNLELKHQRLSLNDGLHLHQLSTQIHMTATLTTCDYGGKGIIANGLFSLSPQEIFDQSLALKLM
ncbi:hypothetical protein IFR05_017471 [Cadophora sp. M221]|nr:hypothetical protein IFR05_017471 [Cadophora sp. M221]